MIELLALIGLIVIAVIVFNLFKNVCLNLSGLFDSLLDRLVARSIQAPSQPFKDTEHLKEKLEAIKKSGLFPEEKELQDEIDRLTSPDQS